MFKKWLGRLSPFVVLSVVTALLFFAQLILAKGAEWKFAVSLKLFTFLLVLLVLDFVFKLAFTKDYVLWVVELFLCLALLYYWVIS